MLYALAVFFPPLALLFAGKPFQFVINIFLTLCGVIPGVIHALFAVSSYYSDQRAIRIISMIKQKS